MLFLLFGSSAGGKSFVLDVLRERWTAGLAIHDFDEIGVPPGANKAWRQQADELWVRRALDYQSVGIDLLLAAQTPFGELLSTPSAPHVEAISACLLDCDAETRRARLRTRPRSQWSNSPERWPDLLNWAAWMRMHAEDPQWMPEVISGGGAWPEMRWERWSGWRAGDPRWRVRIVETPTSLSSGSRPSCRRGSKRNGRASGRERIRSCAGRTPAARGGSVDRAGAAAAA